MRRGLFIFMALFIVSYMNAQTPEMPMVNGKICYTEVIQVDSTITASDLYSNAREWFALAYKSANKVIQMDDKDKQKIVGKANLQVYVKTMGTNYPAGYINYTISIQAKDGRYKYEITDFYHTAQPGTSIPDYGPCEDMINSKKKQSGVPLAKSFDQILTQTNENMKLLVFDLKSHMTSPQKQEEDW